MARIGEKTRLNPPFMSAFREARSAKDAKMAVEARDADGNRVIAARRRLGAVVSESAMRSLVRDDLETLVNTISLASSEAMEGLGRVQESILNFGLPEVMGRSLGAAGRETLTDEVRKAVAVFEPRLIPSTLNVEFRSAEAGESERVRLLISADLRCEPAPVPVEFLADVDVADGKLKLVRR